WIGNEQPLRPADERIPAFVEAKGLVGRTSDADANCARNTHVCFGSLTSGFGKHQHAKPERPPRKKVETIQTSVDPERCGKPPWPAREFEKLRAISMPLHHLDAFQRFQRANQHPSANAGTFAGNVQHKVHAVIEKNVDVTVAQKKCAVARRRTPKVVSRGIAGWVAFRLYDSATEPALWQIVHHDLSNQKPRQFQRV